MGKGKRCLSSIVVVGILCRGGEWWQGGRGERGGRGKHLKFFIFFLVPVSV
jgi:hypothetical protein